MQSNNKEPKRGTIETFFVLSSSQEEGRYDTLAVSQKYRCPHLDGTSTFPCTFEESHIEKI
jgi:hypothetical protein